jgi:hypothetical protein
LSEGLADLFTKQTNLLGVLDISSKYSFGTNSKGMDLLMLHLYVNNTITHIKKFSSLKATLVKKQQPLINHYVVYDSVRDEISRIIGPVDDYESCLIAARYYSNLHFKPVLMTETLSPPSLPINHRTDIISIDGPSTVDIDDAISFSNNELTIYISDVTSQVLFNKHPFIFSSLYSPIKRFDMLTETVATDVCSLKENQIRPVVSLQLTLTNDNTLTTSFKNEFITVNKNLTYDFVDTTHLCDHIICWVNNVLNDSVSIPLINLKQYFMRKQLINQTPSLINNSHELIEFCMLCYNHLAGMVIPNGIYRVKEPDSFSTYSFNPDLHDTLGITHYCHVSSPIRRWVDQYNQRQLKRFINGLQHGTSDIIDPSVLIRLNKWDQNNKQLSALWNAIEFAFMNEEIMTEMNVINVDVDKRMVIFERQYKKYRFYVNELFNVHELPFKPGDVISVKLGRQLLCNDIRKKLICFPVSIHDLFC